MTKQISERELALDILLEVTRDGKYSHLVLRSVLEKYQYLDKKERAFLTRLTEGTLERMLELDYILNQFSKVKVEKMKPVIRNILRSALYQILYMDQVPDSAACNEAVKLAVKRGFHTLKGFVNGVLRTIAREKAKIVYPPKSEREQFLSVTYSMPLWIVKKWMKSYGAEVTEQMLEAFLQDKPLVVRHNPMVMSKEAFLESLQKEQVQVTPHPYLPYAYEISGFDYLADLEAFRQGGFYVQDISSMLVAAVADPKEGDLVLDVCGAPGGKALHMAELMKGTGKVQARDLTAYKVGLIEENIDRCGLANIEAKQQDATILDESMIEQADVVLADLPCSGLGILGKKTDLKYKVTEQQLEELATLQRQILSVVQAYVKPGGTLVYSTCTINEEENQGNVHWFLEKHPDFRLVSIEDIVCEGLREDVEEEGTLQLLPGVHKSDGFFLAKFRKA